MDKNERVTREKKSITNKVNNKKGHSGSNNSIPIGGSNNSDASNVLVEDTWECSVCTYRNSQEAFKCLICDVCKGTSTRKPRYNHDLVAQQVKKQQIQIHQKLLKSSRQFGANDSKDSKDSNDSSSKEIIEKTDGKEIKESKSKEHKESKGTHKEGPNDSQIETRGHHHHHHHTNIKESKGKESKDSKDEVKEPRGSRVKGGKGAANRSTGKQSTVNSIEEAGPSANRSQNNNSVQSNNNCNNNSSSPSSSSASTDHQHENGLTSTISNNHLIKVTKSRKNQIKSSLMKMKNIDRNNFLAQAVTVNNVTVIITEFQPKKKFKTTKKMIRQTASKKEKD